MSQAEEGGFTYYAQCRDTTRIKIGLSDDPAARVASLNSGSSTLVELLAVEPGGRVVEARRHAEFAAARVTHITGLEWFYPVPPLVDLIVGLGGTPARDPIIPGTVAGWYDAYGRSTEAAKALREVERQRSEFRVARSRLRNLYDLVYSVMRIRFGRARAKPFAPRGDAAVSSRAAAEAAELVFWLSPAVASRMDDDDLDLDSVVKLLKSPVLGRASQRAPRITAPRLSCRRSAGSRTYIEESADRARHSRLVAASWRTSIEAHSSPISPEARPNQGRDSQRPASVGVRS